MVNDRSKMKIMELREIMKSVDDDIISDQQGGLAYEKENEFVVYAATVGKLS